MVKIGFIGAGKVATALAVGLETKRYAVVSVASRTRASAEKLALLINGCQVYDKAQGVADSADLVFVTTPDDVIEYVVAQISWHSGQNVVHCSGVSSLDILHNASESGASVGVLHPLQSFASVGHAVKNLPGSTFALEGNGLLLEQLKEIASALEGNYVELAAGDKVLYHAAAVITSNYLVTLMKLATDLWATFGVSTTEAIRALSPLLQGTVNNIITVGLPNCLTGPIARGDLGTIEMHIDAFKEKAPSLLSIYRELGLNTIPIALDKGGIDIAKAEKLQKILLED